MNGGRVMRSILLALLETVWSLKGIDGDAWPDCGDFHFHDGMGDWTSSASSLHRGR